MALILCPPENDVKNDLLSYLEPFMCSLIVLEQDFILLWGKVVSVQVRTVDPSTVHACKQ